MNLEPVTARLAAAALTRQPIGEIEDLALLRAKPPRFFPTMFVANDRERGAAPREQIGDMHDQLVDCDFMIAVYTDPAGQRGKSGAQVRRELRDAIEALFFGWVHPDADGKPTAFAGFELVQITPEFICFGLRFRTVRRLRATITRGTA